jgi:fructose-1,6-bisphosphatase/inositol monophosphatase family enzyme
MTSSLDDKTLTNCLYAAQAAALRAGNRIMTFFGRSMDIMNKGYGSEKSDLVTRADQEAQEIIEKILFEYHPSIGFLAEENGFDQTQDRFEKPYFWSVDPIDGTHAFVRQQNGFAVSIALVAQNGEPILGVCYFPATEKLFYGIKNRGTWLNESPVCLSNLQGDIKILISEAETLPRERNAFFHHLCDTLSHINGINKAKPEMVTAPVQKGCMILTETTPVLYYGVPRGDLGVCLWDLSAIAAIILAAGGYVSDIFGNPLDLNRKKSTFIHHKGFVFTGSKEMGNATVSAFKKFNYKA